MTMKNDGQDTTPMDCIFGPVPSRRLGMSLGVDIVPMKVCSYDCIYCEVGKTTLKTLERREYVSERSVARALERYFGQGEQEALDYVTFSGSGEPTLNSAIGSLIRKVKELTDTPVAVLTNGSLLYMEDVREDLAAADLVIPSLDAVTPDAFSKVNRPADGMDLETIIEGIRKFAQEFRGEIWLEILLVRGINDSMEHAAVLADAARTIRTDKIQLTTVARPSGTSRVEPVDGDKLVEIAKLFTGNVEIVADFNRHENPAYNEERGEQIVKMLRIRPMSVQDLSASLGIHPNEVVKYLDQLSRDHKVREERFDGRSYFTLDR